MFKHEFLRLSSLWDPAQPRSTLPLSRATAARLSQCSGSRDDRAHNKAHRLPLERRRRPKKKKRHQKQIQDFRKVPVCTHLSLLPAEAALRFRVLADSTDGSSAAPSWTSDAVRLADGPANKKTIVISRRSNNSIEQKSKAKVVRCTLESVCATGATSGSGGLL